MRSGPSGQEVILTHAVSRLMLAGHIDNIQVSESRFIQRLLSVTTHTLNIPHNADASSEYTLLYRYSLTVYLATPTHPLFITYSTDTPTQYIHTQVSWVKEGFRMAQVLLDCGVNDLGT